MVDRNLPRDLIEEGLPPQFREELLRDTIRTARKRRSTQRALAGMAALLLMALLALELIPGTDVEQPFAGKGLETESALPPRSYQSIRTVTFSNVIRTGDHRPTPRLSTHMEGVAILNSVPSFRNGLVQISDQELFRMLEGKAIAVVKIPDAPDEIIFLDEPARHGDEARPQ